MNFKFNSHLYFPFINTAKGEYIESRTNISLFKTLCTCIGFYQSEESEGDK